MLVLMKTQEGGEEYIDICQVARYETFRDNTVRVTFKNGDTAIYQGAGRWKSIMTHLR